MTITHTSNHRPVLLKDVSYGQVFRYDFDYYMRVEDEHHGVNSSSVVCLSNGTMDELRDETNVVEVIGAELTIPQTFE